MWVKHIGHGHILTREGAPVSNLLTVLIPIQGKYDFREIDALPSCILQCITAARVIKSGNSLLPIDQEPNLRMIVIEWRQDMVSLTKLKTLAFRCFPNQYHSDWHGSQNAIKQLCGLWAVPDKLAL
jgi:hypothetical protein